jgi:hypothetical protein
MANSQPVIGPSCSPRAGSVPFNSRHSRAMMAAPCIRGGCPRNLYRFGLAGKDTRTAPRRREVGPHAGPAAVNAYNCSLYARMLPTTRSCCTARRPAPRTRGDGPDVVLIETTQVFCSSGMVPSRTRSPGTSSSATRTRGGSPTGNAMPASLLRCSPHPQGWSRALQLVVALPGLLPACQGMAPVRRSG